LSQAVGAAHFAGLEDLCRAFGDPRLHVESGTEQIDPLEPARPEVQVDELLDYLARAAIAHNAEPPEEAMSRSDRILARGSELESGRRTEPALEPSDDCVSTCVLLQTMWKKEPSVGVDRQGVSQAREVAVSKQLDKPVRAWAIDRVLFLHV